LLTISSLFNTLVVFVKAGYDQPDSGAASPYLAELQLMAHGSTLKV
jgi:hypothetical protein